MSREEAAEYATRRAAAAYAIRDTLATRNGWDMADAALAAADAHDAAHGTHRVSLDDATVERAIGEVSHHVTPVIGWMILAASQGRDPDQYHDALTERIELAARAVLAAAVEADGE